MKTNPQSKRPTPIIRSRELPWRHVITVAAALAAPCVCHGDLSGGDISVVKPDRVYIAPETGRFTLEWADIADASDYGYGYVVERSVDLKNWECVGGDAIRYDRESRKFVYTEQGNFPTAFYRIYEVEGEPDY